LGMLQKGGQEKPRFQELNAGTLFNWIFLKEDTS
jgi:hypothetical protein